MPNDMNDLDILLYNQILILDALAHLLANAKCPADAALSVLEARDHSIQRQVNNRKPVPKGY